MPTPGQEETVRVVALDRSFHLQCYRSVSFFCLHMGNKVWIESGRLGLATFHILLLIHSFFFIPYRKINPVQSF